MKGEMSCEQVRELAPELTIGIADGQQRDAALRHAATCPDCRQLISELSSVMDDLLLLAPSHEPPPAFAARTVASISPPAAVPEGMRDPVPSPARRARQPRRALARAGTRLRWAAAAAVCLAAASAGGGLWLSSGVGGTQAGALTLTGKNPATHVSATAILTATSWGTSIQLQVRGLPENVECRLVVRSRGGGTEVSGAWDAWQEGPVSIPASVSWLPSDIASLQVTTLTRSLVTISVTHPAAGAGR